jgi:hypothetical protein
MMQAPSWNWVGVLAFICGAAVIIPRLVALAQSCRCCPKPPVRLASV